VWIIVMQKTKDEREREKKDISIAVSFKNNKSLLRHYLRQREKQYGHHCKPSINYSGTI